VEYINGNLNKRMKAMTNIIDCLLITFFWVIFFSLFSMIPHADDDYCG